MAPTLYFIVIQTLIATVSAYTGQYLQYGTPYPSPYITGYPAQSYTPKPAPVYTQQYVQPSYPFAQAPNKASPSYQEYKAPKVTGYYDQAIKSGSYQPTAAISPVTAPKVQVQQTAPTIKETPKLPKADIPKAVPPFDTNVLNNLAIALQLLIVSNLIHNPPPESKTVSEILDEDIIPAIAALPIPYIPNSSEHVTRPDPYEYQVYAMPNANFLGTSSFGDTGLSQSMMGGFGSPTVAKPRPTGLMSPYDAIANSPYSETPRQESTRSQYHLSSDYKDLFSLTELFKV